MVHDETGGVEIPPALAEIAAGWPLAASLAAATVGGLRAGRRRTALNEALHELRRPLQAVALAAGPGGEGEPRLEGSLQMAALALERLEREINGKPAAAETATLPAKPLLEAAVERWRGRAALAGGSLELRWHAGEPRLAGDRYALAQALDNLIVNAIEHGGGRVSVEGKVAGGRLRVSVRDSGPGSRSIHRRPTPARLIGRVSGRRRHGHGLRVVRRTAADHGGGFELRRSGSGTAALLELPLARAGGTA
ncbi:MAG TPA: ATP-binding protein [Thermoanaerobaculia bacterium]|nr:ATP-binding protein [Thermoanaerobaculia bacterium]